MADGIRVMTDNQPGRLTGLLAAFIEAHPGTRRGHLFGCPAAYAGRRAFAEMTGAGLACRVSIRTIRDRRWSGGLFRPDGRSGWVVVSKALLDAGEVAKVTTVLELAAIDAATAPLQPVR